MEVVWELSLGNLRLGSLDWEFRSGTLAQELCLSFASELLLGNFRLGTFACELSFGDFSLETFIWSL